MRKERKEIEKGNLANNIIAQSKTNSFCSFCQQNEDHLTKFQQCKTSNCLFGVCKNDLSELFEFFEEDSESNFLPCGHLITRLEINGIKSGLNK